MEQNNAVDVRTKPMTVGNWFVTMLLSFIPVVNIICFIVWAVSGSTNKNKQNWARAMWIWAAISVVIGIVLTIVAGSFLKDLFSGFMTT